MSHVYLRKGAMLDQADAVFTITGNGMAPIIRDGDDVLVKFTDTLEPGAIGVFMIDGKLEAAVDRLRQKHGSTSISRGFRDNEDIGITRHKKEI